MPRKHKGKLYGYHKITSSTTLWTPPRMVQVEELDAVQRVQLATCAKVKLWRKEMKYFVGNMVISTARAERKRRDLDEVLTCIPPPLIIKQIFMYKNKNTVTPSIRILLIERPNIPMLQKGKRGLVGKLVVLVSAFLSILLINKYIN